MPKLSMLEVEGFILVGGASSRMGTDKARLRLNGQTFVERIATALAPIAERVSVVGVKEGDETLRQFPAAADVHAGWGALGGVHAALATCRARWAAVVACDLPLVTGELFARLDSLRTNFDAVAPVQTDGRPQPLCALYRTEPCLRRAGELISSGERRPRALLSSVKTRWVHPVELADLAGATDFFINVNTPEDYAHAQRRSDEGLGMRDD